MDLSSPSHPVLSSLLRKWQEVVAEIKSVECQLNALLTDVDALDATIRLFAPAMDVEHIRVRPTPRRHGVRPGDTTALILGMLRERGAMTSPQITVQ